MVILPPSHCHCQCQPLIQNRTLLHLPFFIYSRHTNCFAPFPTVSIRLWCYAQPRTPLCLAKATPEQNLNTLNLPDFGKGDDDFDGEDGFSIPRGFRGRDDEKDYDRDPEFAEILGTCLDDPEKARSKVSF